MNKSIAQPTAKKAASGIRKRSFEIAFGWKSEKYLFFAWILLLALSIILAFLINDWTAEIHLSKVNPDVGVSVTRLDRNRLEVMITSIERDTDIEHITYYTSRGSGYVNQSANPLSPVRDAGESGVIPVSGYNEEVEIFAVLPDDKIKIFSSRI